MLENGKLGPNWPVVDFAGSPHALWDFRQKSHVILLHLPGATPAQRDEWRAAVEKNKKRWDWLNATFVTLKEPANELPAGVYVIDRYGRLWNSYAADGWTLETLENDLVYYEARHC